MVPESTFCRLTSENSTFFNDFVCELFVFKLTLFPVFESDLSGDCFSLERLFSKSWADPSLPTNMRSKWLSYRSSWVLFLVYKVSMLIEMFDSESRDFLLRFSALCFLLGRLALSCGACLENSCKSGSRTKPDCNVSVVAKLATSVLTYLASKRTCCCESRKSFQLDTKEQLRCLTRWYVWSILRLLRS